MVAAAVATGVAAKKLEKGPYVSAREDNKDIGLYLEASRHASRSPSGRAEGGCVDLSIYV